MFWLAVGFAIYHFLYPAYNHEKWSRLVSQGILMGSDLRRQVTPRLLSARPGEPVDMGLAIKPAGAVSGGRVNANGTIVVHVTISKLLFDDHVTVILVPTVDAQRTRVDWTCGVDRMSSLRSVPSTCRVVLPLPD